jgi:hypothetical protein
MPKTASPLHSKRVPKGVSKPTETAEAAATVAESVAEQAATPAPGKVKSVAGAPVAVASTAAKTAKSHKPKLVRDSFTMPKDEYQVLDTLKRRALLLEKHVRKSELLRAGVQALAAMSDRAFLKAVGSVPTLKTGRPKTD